MATAKNNRQEQKEKVNIKKACWGLGFQSKRFVFDPAWNDSSRKI